MKGQPADTVAVEGIASPARPRIGLALGSGSARGLAHIGVLRAIKEAGIEIDVIAGTSMGALIGAIFAAGELDNLAARFVDFDWESIASLLDPVLPRSGLIDGRKVADFVRAHMTATRIEDLPIPFRAVATDIMNGEQAALGMGDLIEAARASIAVPGIFTPVRANDRTLVDVGLVNPVPVSVAREAWAPLGHRRRPQPRHRNQAYLASPVVRQWQSLRPGLSTYAGKPAIP